MIIGVAGPIASGKSTLSRALATRFSAKLLSFGDYVRHVARSRGIDVSDRRALQDLGQSLVAGDVRSFVSGALDLANVSKSGDAILDGVRHHAVWTEIVTVASLNGQSAKLVFLDMPEQERQRRLAIRGLSRDQAVAQDSHACEADVQQRLKSQADLRVDALMTEAAMVAVIDRHLGIS